MINCAHLVAQHGVSLFLFQLNLNKLYPIRVTKVEESAYTIYQRRLYKENVGRNVSNAPDGG